MKGYKHLTSEQRNEIAALYTELGSTRAVCDRMGLPIQRVEYALAQQGVARNNQRPNACTKNADMLRQMASAGLTLSEMGRRVGTNKRYVKAWLLANGIAYIPWERTGPGNPHWHGGRIVDPDGYILLHRPDHPNCDRHGYVREHRLVMETILGRLLLRTEVVHHRDDNSLNNSPDNLFLYGSNAEHLAETLKGKKPNWTDEGFARMKAPRPHKQGPQRKSNPDPLELNASP